MANSDYSYSILRYDPTTGSLQYFNGADWYNVTDSALDAVSVVANAALPKAGGTMTGPLVFSGTTTYLQIPVLTSTQRDALTAAKGMLIYNSSTDALNYYDGGWKVVSHA